MAIRPSPIRGGPCPKYRASPRQKPKEQTDIKVASHKKTVQHSVRAQKLDERQLSQFFKSLDDLKIKRLLQIDKEMSEQEMILEKLDYEREIAREQRLARRGNSSRSCTFGDSGLSSLLPEHFKRGTRPSVRRGSSNFDLYAFMMRRESDHHAVAPYDAGTNVREKASKKLRLRKQSPKSPLPKSPSKATDLEDQEDPVSARGVGNETEYRVVSPGKSEHDVSTTSPVSNASIARSESIGSLPPSPPVSEFNDDDVGASVPKRHLPSGSDWQDEAGRGDVDKDNSERVRQRSPRSKQPQVTRGGSPSGPKSKDKTNDGGGDNANPISQVKGAKTPSDSGVWVHGSQRKRRPRVERLKKEVSFHFDDGEDKRDVLDGTGVAIGAGIMQKNNLLKAAPTSSPFASSPGPECKEPDCIFHNKAYRKADHADDDDYTIDDYYRTVGAKPAVSPIFMPAGSPRSWSRRGVVRPPSPNLSDFLREFDQDKPSTETSTGSLAESDSFLSVRRPLKGSNRERTLKDKEENVRTTFNLMRQKMADQKPPEFNQNYGAPTPNWKILNPLKMRHKINQSNPLHVRWGL